MSLAGREAKLQINGTSGSWNELAITREASDELTRDLFETTTFGQDGVERGAEGPVDFSIDITCLRQASQPTAWTDIRDAILNGTEIDIEFSPDGNASGGPTDVVSASVKCESKSGSASVGSEQTQEATLVNSNGQKPSYGSTFS